MSENRVGETKLREQQERAVEKSRACEHSSAHLAWKIVGGMALAVVAVGVIRSLDDIRRYIRISTM